MDDRILKRRADENGNLDSHYSLHKDKKTLQELIDYLQNYLIENESQWMEQHFELVHRQSFQFTSLKVIQQFCTNLMAKFPYKIFNSLDFTSIPKKSLVQLIKSDSQMKEIEVWEHVLKWVRPYQKLFKRQFMKIY
ncbi:hypothetical protein RhiirA1_472604 [Rhizophagus irregularis]|uniref:BACK domain-containing protein n=1 Tax=Rhizophagus irregularis TaxID=588596 RepID=A0A2N0R278_9GLOM|nr:hypothetical protein RhiirA1_472604 [Rhizophagus irregularis]